MLSYVWKDLVRNPRRTVASLAGVALGVGLFSGVLFFIDGSAATLTRRAIAPVALDMQRVLTSPLGRRLAFEERLSAPGPLASGQDATLTLTVTNDGSEPAHEVVVNDEPPPPLSYVHGSTTLDGAPLPDVAGQSPLAQGLARSGLNVGTVEPGATVTLTYLARANQDVPDLATLSPQGRISSREDVVPSPANAPPPMTLEQLATEIGRIPGVVAADGLSFVDLEPGSLAAGGAPIDRPVRVFGFDAGYRDHHPSIRIVDGGLGPSTALISAEAARALSVGPGGAVSLLLPDRAEPVALTVGGVADLSRATPLFASRKSSKLEDFLYVPDAVVVSPDTFMSTIVPAFRAASATQGRVLKTLPVLEVDVMVDRTGLPADPGRALDHTKAVASAVNGIAAGQDYLIDNISNALEVARGDAAVGKRMFVFLGVPGVVLAAYLAAYAGSILASTQRREQANLRIRGADRGTLLRILTYKTLILAAAGSILGVGLGLLSVMAILGVSSLTAAATTDLIVSGFIALTVGVLAIALALYIPGRRALQQEIADERRELARDPAPAWRRWRLDLVLVIGALLVAGVALRVGAFDAPAGVVSLGQSVSLPTYLLLAPLVAWIGGTLLSVRMLQMATAHVPVPGPPGYGPAVRGTLSRSLRRRSWTLGTGMVGIALVVAFGVNLAIFSSTYDAAKQADARFVVGSDLRITPSVLSGEPHPAAYASSLEVPGVTAVAPVVFELENAVLIGPYDQDRADLAAIDPASFRRAAPLSDALFGDGTAAATMAALQDDPQGLLVRADLAEELSVENGDDVQVVLARGTDNQTVTDFHVVGRFEQLPGFPEGVSLVGTLDRYAEATGLGDVTFFLARTTSPGRAGVERAVAELEGGPGRADPITIDSTETVLSKDQSSLTALDINGLVQLDLVATLLMSVACVAIFVFGLLLQRRREYVTLLAHGMPILHVGLLVLGEAGLVAFGGLVAGALVGLGMAYLFVHVLRPLFVLDPQVTFDRVDLAALLLLPIVATALSALLATVLLRRMRPTELLRET